MTSLSRADLEAKTGTHIFNFQVGSNEHGETVNTHRCSKAHGRHVPTWQAWGFNDRQVRGPVCPGHFLRTVCEGLSFFETYLEVLGVSQVPIRLVFRSLGGRWITWKALQGREVSGIWCWLVGVFFLFFRIVSWVRA